MIDKSRANQGVQFEAANTWHCDCGATRRFDAYAAAHWHEPLTHTSSCGVVRVFLGGRATRYAKVKAML
jgi:hypothetical protein